MSRFYGAVEGTRGRGTRLGTAKSGLETYAAGWKGAIKVTLDAQGDDIDRYTVDLVPWQASGGRTRTLASGVLDARDATMSDWAALNMIASLVRTSEWNADLCEPILDLIRATGRGTDEEVAS